MFGGGGECLGGRKVFYNELTMVKVFYLRMPAKKWFEWQLLQRAAFMLSMLRQKVWSEFNPTAFDFTHPVKSKLPFG